MDDAKLAIVGKVVGVLQILMAIVYFDLSTWIQIAVSALLFLGGLLILTIEVKSESFKRARSVLSYLAIAIALALIIRWLIVG